MGIPYRENCEIVGRVPETPHAPTMMPYVSVPIIINSFNRLTSLQRLVKWLRQAGQRRIIILDNASTYTPLLVYLKSLRNAGDIQVIFLSDNYGSRALWRTGLLRDLKIDCEYVYTDPDVVPVADCPKDMVRVLQHILKSEPSISKIGLGLKIDDIPQQYRHRTDVLTWETQYWLRPVGRGLYRAHVDTTFALYRPGSDRALGIDNVRIGWPYLGIHESWYSDSARPTEEEVFYSRTAVAPISTWSVDRIPDWLEADAKYLSKNRQLLLHVGNYPDPIPGFLNLNQSPAASSRQDRETIACQLIAELTRGCVDGVYGCLAFDDLEPGCKWLGVLFRVMSTRAKAVLRITCDGGNYSPERLLKAVHSRIFACIPKDVRVGNSCDLGGMSINFLKLAYVKTQDFAGLEVSKVFPQGSVRDDAVEVIVHFGPDKPLPIRDGSGCWMGESLNSPIDMSIDFSLPDPPAV